MTRCLRVALLALLAVLACLQAAPVAHGAQGDYGPWFPAPGQFGKEDPRLYRADIQPFSSPDIKELTNFTCLNGKGFAVSVSDQNALGGIFKDAVDQFHGRLEGDTKDGEHVKSAYPAGVTGMQQFLRDSQKLLRDGGWVRFRERENSGTINYPYWHGKYTEALASIAAKEAELEKLEQKRAAKLAETRSLPRGSAARKAAAKEYGELAVQVSDVNAALAEARSKMDVLGPRPELAKFIDPKVTAPLNVAHMAPEGCGLNPLDVAGVRFMDLITNTEGFFSDLIISLIAKPVREGYNFLQPYAFIYTFWTPHTERGDTMFNTATSCEKIGKNGGSDASIANSASDVRNACASGEPLGFDKRRDSERELKKTMPWYISAGIFLQWLISGFYFIILFAAAVLYMVRGNKNTQLNVLHLIPKLILSALLTMFAPFLIGALISFSNVFVTTMFDFDSARSVGRINDILAQSDSFVSIAGDFVGRLVKVMVGGFTVFFFAFFVLGSLIRQLLLIGLVVLAPVACFCLMVPRWQGQFNRYVRALLVIVFAPALMAFILKLGMSMNPIIIGGGDVSNMAGLIGLLLMVVTLWAMTKVLKVSAAVATGNQGLMKSLTGRTMGSIGQFASMAGMATGNPMLAGAGRALQAGGQVGAAAEGVGASLVPAGKGVAGMGGGMSSGLGSGRRSGQRGLGSGSGGGLLGLPSAGGSGYGAMGTGMQRRSFGQRFQEHLVEKQAENGEQRVSHRMAMGYKRDMAQEVAAKENELGRRMSGYERDQFLHGSFMKDESGLVLKGEDGRELRNDNGYYQQHGKLDKRAGNYFIAATEDDGGKLDRPRSKYSPVSVAQRVAAEAGKGASGLLPDKVAGAAALAAAKAESARGRAADVKHRASGGTVPGTAADSHQAQHRRAEHIASDPDELASVRAQGQQWLDEHESCPRCHGPMVAGACADPACSPARRRRSASTVDDLLDELESSGTV